MDTSNNNALELREEFPIESLLSARQFLHPELSGSEVFFIANTPGHYGLYSMPLSGGVPIPLIPESIALQNPHLMNGKNFAIFPRIDKIIVMIDENGNELYQPTIIPMTGGIPKPLFGDKYTGQQVNIIHADIRKNIIFFVIDDRKEPGMELVMVNLETMETTSLGKTPYGLLLLGISSDLEKAILAEGYGNDDIVLFYWEKATNQYKEFFGTPLDKREDQSEFHPTGFWRAFFVEEDAAILIQSMLFDDNYGVARVPLDKPSNIQKVTIEGLDFTGIGSMEDFQHIWENRFLLIYNIDGVSHVYEAEYDPSQITLVVKKHLIGLEGGLNNGVVLGLGIDELAIDRDPERTKYVISFTKATMPSQLYLVDSPWGQTSSTIRRLTNERVLGIPFEFLSEGEPANYISHDGLEISARLYMPSEKLGYIGSRPLVVYIHGGPQSQERPDFTWFSMPLIQFLTLHGFAVFVPNVRGSTGYGHKYMSMVARDWGGKDRLDHIEGLKFLEKDPRIDSSKRFVVGRSYGGFMTLTLMSRHSELWKGGCDMFGPYDLIGFYYRLPKSWQVYFDRVLGNPERDREFLIERSPKTYLDALQAPLLVVQGKNDPRVLVDESKELVENLRRKGKQVELLVFEDEGHDVIKFHNKVKCYTEITRFFLKHLQE